MEAAFLRGFEPLIGVVLVVMTSKEPRFLIVVVVKDMDRSGFKTRFVVVVIVFFFGLEL